MNVDFNVDADHIDVPIKKYNLIGLFLLVFALFVLGCCFVIHPSVFVVSTGDYRYRSPVQIFMLGLLFIVPCGSCAFLLLYRVLDARPGLAINLKDITNRTSIFTSDLIDWSDITEVSTENDKYPIYVIIYINDPLRYIKRKNLLARYFASSNYRRYGSPIVIDAYQLKCDYDELCAFMETTFKTYKEDKE